MTRVKKWLKKAKTWLNENGDLIFSDLALIFFFAIVTAII